MHSLGEEVLQLLVSQQLPFFVYPEWLRKYNIDNLIYWRYVLAIVIFLPACLRKKLPARYTNGSIDYHQYPRRTLINEGVGNK